jgi:hypothetical protein
VNHIAFINIYDHKYVLIHEQDDINMYELDSSQLNDITTKISEFNRLDDWNKDGKIFKFRELSDYLKHNHMQRIDFKSICF